MADRNDNSIFQFMIREKYITLTTIGSIFTFAFISSMKEDIVDPLISFMLPNQNFDFMDITIREGEKYEIPDKQLELKFGHFFKSFITWLFIVAILYVLYKFTSFPDTFSGNATGSAVM